MYELTLIFEPDLTNDACDAIIEKLRIVLDSKEVWGKRLLAYHVKKWGEGIYYFIQTHGAGSGMKELERKLNLEGKILRYLLIAKEER